MEERKIQLPFYLGIQVEKILKEKHNITHKDDIPGIMRFTTEELELITSIEIKNPMQGSLDGVHLLPNLETLKVESSAITAHLQDKDILSISDKDIKSISKCISLKNLSIVNQARVSYIDVSELENLETINITHNQHLEQIQGLDKLQKICELNCYGNNRLFEIGKLDKIIENSLDLSEVKLDVLLFPEAIGYNLRTGEYNKQAVDKLKEMYTVKWCEGLNGNRAIEINNYQMIQIHNKACEILEENIPKQGNIRDTIIGIESYLSRNVKYDYDSMKNGHSNGSYQEIDGINVRLRNGPKVGANGAYNALIRNTCVCEGYTRAMQYLLKLKGINSHNVDCYAEKDSTHMADGTHEDMYTRYKMPVSSEYHSIICIDDYNCLYDDPCWNACYYQAGDKSMPWLLKTKEEISRDHTLSFDERVVSNNALKENAEIIKSSIKRNDLFIQSKTRVSSIAETKKDITRGIKGQIIENGRTEL